MKSNIYKDLAYIFKTLDGGDGSGNFGHEGRAGEVGGSSDDGSGAETVKRYGQSRITSDKEKRVLNKMSEVRKKNYLKIINNEEKITNKVSTSLDKHNTKMKGETYAIKQPDSFDRKIDQEMRERGMTEMQAAEYLNDVIRYTSISSGKTLAKDTENVINDLKNDGHKVLSIKNTWSDDKNPYKGINVKMMDEDGVKYEIQFHTAQSFNMKEVKQHPYYEEYRKHTTTAERKEELTAIMWKFITENKHWNRPADIENVNSDRIKINDKLFKKGIQNYRNRI